MRSHCLGARLPLHIISIVYYKYLIVTYDISYIYNMKFVGFGIHRSINVEPGLLDWYNLNTNATQMTTDELKRYRLNVNSKYKPIVPSNKIDPEESQLGEYDRMYTVAKSLIDRHKHKGMK